jgi:hypothetical protein
VSEVNDQLASTKLSDQDEADATVIGKYRYLPIATVGDQEEYRYYDEAEEVVGDDGRPLGTSGFARADAGQLQKRRIIKAGRRFRQAQPTNGGANGGATPAPVARAAAAPAASAAPGGNPFGGIALTATAPAPTPATGGGSNPFAQVNLLGAASATPAPAVPGAFNFGAASNVPKVQPAPKLFPTKAAAPAAAPSAPLFGVWKEKRYPQEVQRMQVRLVLRQGLSEQTPQGA